MKLKSNTKSWMYYALSFALPFFVLLVCVFGLRVVPFDRSVPHNLGISDGRMYVMGLAGTGRLFRGEENFLYSLGSGLGVNRWSGLAWGGLAPVNILSVFATLENAPALFTWIVIISLSLCGPAMYALLAYLRGHKLSHLIFSTTYAMTGFNAAFCYHYYFMIGPWFLPLVVLGLVRMFRGKSPLFYIVSLAAPIFFNFYFGFHLCVASCVCLLAYLYEKGGELDGGRLKLCGTWAASSVIAGLLPAFLWLPTLKAYGGGDGRLNQTTLAEYQFAENMPFIQMFSKFFSGANSLSEQVNGLPNIFCGILVVALVILFFLNRDISKRIRQTAAATLGFYLLSCYVIVFTLVMHGGTHTNWFNYRYSYAFTFFMILIAAAQFQYLDKLTVQDAKKCGAILLISTILIFSVRYEFISGVWALFDLALLVLMWTGFWLYKTKPAFATRRALSVFLLLTVSVNLYANFFLTIKKMREWELDIETYNNNILKSGAMVDAIKQADDSEFFRMEKDESESGSVGADPALYGYNGVSASGPALRMYVHKGLNKLGINWFDMRHWYSEGIPAATDSLLGLKYLISSRDLDEEKGYERRLTVDVETLIGGAGDTDNGDHNSANDDEKIADENAEDEKDTENENEKVAEVKNIAIFQNHDALSPAILAENDCINIELGNNVFENLNQVWKSITGGGQDIFTMRKDVTFELFNNTVDRTVTSAELRTRASMTEAGENPETLAAHIEYSFTAEQDGAVYLFDTSIPDSANGLQVPAIKCCGVYKTGDTVSDVLYVNGDYANGDLFYGYCANLAFAYADQAVLSDYSALLNSRDITFHVERDNQLTGEVRTDKARRVLFTIPWDEGWTCYIDGEKTPIDRTWDLFMSVEIPEGTHHYEMRFFPAWMNIGLTVSGAALFALCVFMILWTRRQKRRELVNASDVAGGDLVNASDMAGVEMASGDLDAVKPGTENLNAIEFESEFGAESQAETESESETETESQAERESEAELENLSGIEGGAS